MAKGKRKTGAQVKAEILKRISGGNRAIFHDPLAEALRGLKHANWKDAAQDDPEKVVRSIRTLSSLSGYVEKSVHATVHYDAAKMTELAETLLARHGPEKLVTIWQSMSLPIGQLPVEVRERLEKPHNGETLEHDAIPALPANVAQ